MVLGTWNSDGCEGRHSCSLTTNSECQVHFNRSEPLYIAIFFYTKHDADLYCTVPSIRYRVY
jgi:hypothetical protein